MHFCVSFHISYINLRENSTSLPLGSQDIFPAILLGRMCVRVILLCQCETSLYQQLYYGYVRKFAWAKHISQW